MENLITPKGEAMPPFITKKDLEFAAFMLAGAAVLGGCETLGPLFEGSFGVERADGQKYECVENLKACTKRCEVITKKGDRYFKNFNLPPDKCKKDEPVK